MTTTTVDAELEPITLADNDGEDRIDMDRIVMLLKRDYGIPANVTMTGGGVATLFAGPTHKDADGDLRYAVCAGPGVYNEVDPSYGYLEEFVVGVDSTENEIPDPIDCAAAGATDEYTIALLIFRFIALGAHNAVPAHTTSTLIHVHTV